MNKVLLLGRVGQDPKIHDFEQRKLARFSLATTERGYKLKDGTEIEPETTWHNIAVNQTGLASVVAQHVRKGSLLAVSGRISERSYTGSDGARRKVYEIIADGMEILSWPEMKDTQSEQAIPDTDGLPF